MNRADDLRSDYDRLGELLHGGDVDAKAAAGIARERRMIGDLLEALEKPVGVSLVDKLAGSVTVLEPRGGTAAGDPGSTSRRRKSG
jgi:hypothetical protein